MRSSFWIARLAVVVALAAGALPLRAVPPGTPQARAAQSFDPFNPSNAPAEQTQEPADAPANAASAGAAVADSANMMEPPCCGPHRTIVVPPTPCLSILDAAPVVQSATGYADATFTVTLSAKSQTVVTVHYATAPSTDGGEPQDDYVSTSGVLTFEPGQTSKQIIVKIPPETSADEDFRIHGLEHFLVNLTSPTNATLCRPQAVGSIQPSSIYVRVFDAPILVQSRTAAQSASFTLALSSPATTAITVSYKTLDGSAHAGVDYTATAASVVFPPMTTSRTVSVPILPGSSAADRHFYLLATGASGAAGVALFEPKGTATIAGSSAGPTLDVDDATISRGKSGPVIATFTVTLTPKSAKTVTVKYATQDGSGSGGAVAGKDYVAKSGALTFAPGQTSQAVPITILADTGTTYRTFTLNLSGAVGAGVDRAQGTCNIVPQSVSVSIATPPPVTRNAASPVPVTFTVSLSSAAASVVTVEYLTSDGSAVAGVDYAQAGGSLSFAVGETTKSVTVQALPGFQTGSKTFALKLSDVVGYGASLGSPASATGTILPGPKIPAISVDCISVNASRTGNVQALFTVSLSMAAKAPVTVAFATSDGTAKAGIDYAAASGTLTFAPGQTTLHVPVTVYPTSEAAAEYFYLNLSHASSNAVIVMAQGCCCIYPPAIDIFASGPPPVQRSATVSETAVFSVSLSAPSPQPITVAYATVDGTAKQNVEYQPASGTLTFPPNTTAQTVKVKVLPGSTPTTSTSFSLQLSNPSGPPGTIITVAKASATILPPLVERTPDIAVDDVTIDRGAANVTAHFLVSLSAASALPVSVNFATADGSGANGAVAGVDYVATSGKLTFTPGQTALTVPVTILPTAAKSDKVFLLNLSSATNGAITRSPGTCTIIPFEIDVAVGNAPPVTRSLTSDQTATFPITLSAASDRPITVTYTAEDGTAVKGRDYVSRSGSVLFPPFTTTQEVTVTVLSGAEASALTFYLQATGASGSAGVTIKTPRGSATIDPPVTALPEISVADTRVEQRSASGVTALFTVTLSKPGTAPVTVQYATADGSATASGPGAAAGEDYLAVNGKLTFSPGQTSKTVDVPITAESRESFGESFTLKLANPSGATIGRGQAVCQIIPPVIAITVLPAPAVARSKTLVTTATFAVVLSAACDRPISVDYHTADATARAGVDYAAKSGTLTFAPGQTSENVKVSVLPGSSATPVTFYLKLANPQGFPGAVVRADASATIGQ